MIPEAQDGTLDKLRELVDRMKVGMLATVDEDGTLRSRPLQTLDFDDDGCLWFFTSATSPKVAEVTDTRGQVSIAYADPGRMDFLSVSGAAQLVRDRARIEQYWTPWVNAWFPQGVDDPDLALLRVTAEKAEYWESPGNAVMRFAGLATALATGNKDALGTNEKVTLGDRTLSR
jgi:general stress protein 26